MSAINQEKPVMSGIIIEGVSGSGKTTALKEVIRSPKYMERDFISSIILSEHQTQRVLEKKDHMNSLTSRDSIELLEDIVSHLRSLYERIKAREWDTENNIGHNITFILERFHLTHVSQYPHLKWSMVRDIDSQLAKLGGKLVLLTANEEDLRQRLFTRKSSCWHRYLQKYGHTEKEIVLSFLKEQDYFKELCETTTLPSLILNTHMRPPQEIAGEIFEFWGLN